MNGNIKRHALALMAAGIIFAQGTALADTISFEGTVKAGSTHEVYSGIGGTVSSVEVDVGQTVSAGDAIAQLSTTKVYAPESGTITGLFGQPGDTAESIAGKYGAVMYIEGDSVYSISASTEDAYNKTENKFVHIGEEVYLSCYSDGDHTGTGVITSIEGTSYNVKVLSGEFLIGETVNVYRGDEAVSSNRIGRGELARTSPTAITGNGSIVSYAVSNGDTVERGDLLFETLEGEFDGLYMSGSSIVADAAGTIAELNIAQGGRTDKGSVAAVMYTRDSMRIEAQVSETDLAEISVGDPVTIELIWNQDEDVTYAGTISMISAIANSSSEATGAAAGADASGSSASGGVKYTVYIDFEPDENTRYGMSAVISTLDATADIEVDTSEQE